MNVAVLHYHLKRGGVTRVIANHLHALHAGNNTGESVHLAIFHGGDISGWPADLPANNDLVRFSLHELPALQYDRPITDAQHLQSQLLAELTDLGWNKHDTLLHVHNHSLGKSLALPNAISNLAGQGWRTLLQIHDFAEDFRPANYRYLVDVAGDDLQSLLYPSAAHIHYTVLNGRDFSALQTAGVHSENLHSLPNPVSPFANLPDQQSARQLAGKTFGVPADATLAVYPVRGITRKNIGEALLYTALGQGRFWAGVTLSPTNPHEREQYERWRSLAESLNLPFIFGMGDEGKLDFLQNLAAADVLMTTSVAEGFGMVFLEANLVGRSLIGRDLPEITSDFVEAGMQFPGLRSRISIPADWVGEDQVIESFTRQFQQLLHAYGLPEQSADLLRNRCVQVVQHGVIDFGMLSATDQSKVITRVHASNEDRDEVFALNPGMAESMTPSRDATEISSANRDIIRSHYSPAAIGARLNQLYQTVLASRVSQEVETVAAADQLLEFFLDPLRMHLIRV